MGWPRWDSFVKDATFMVAALLGSTAMGLSQQPPAYLDLPSAGEMAQANGSLSTVMAEVQELRTVLAEMRDQFAGSRREVQELRDALQAMQEQMASHSAALPPLRSQRATNLGHRAFPAPLAGGPSHSLDNPGAEGATTIDDQMALLREDYELLNARVEGQYQTKVESGSKYRVRLSGVALLNVFSTRGTVDNLDIPSVAEQRGPFDSNGSFGATARQSSLGLEIFGPAVGGAKTSGDMQLDFFGGFPDTENGVTAGIVRLRTAAIRLEWANTSVLAGQEAPFFSPLSPTSFAAIGFPALSYSGNLWTWTPQIRVERRMPLSGDSGISVQWGILNPLTGEQPGDGYYRLPSAGERSRSPAYATRLGWTRGTRGRHLTVGAGAYYSRQDWGLDRTVDAWAATADWDIPLGPWFSFSGEFYRGRAIAGLGGGAGASVLFSGPPASPTSSVLGRNSMGGWSQLKFKPLEKMEFNTAFGEDYPFASDLRRFPLSQGLDEPPTGRNASALLNVIYRARSNLLFSVEYRRLWTSEIDGTKPTADHVNLGAGILF